MTSSIARWFSNYDRSESLGSKLRARRIAPLLEMIREIFEDYGEVNIIDVGGRENYWNIIPRNFLEAHQVSITIVNLEESRQPEDRSPFRFAAADACDLSCFDEDAFHIAHSNSVIEHVGHWERMVKFADEISRVAQKYYVQTPNYWFPVEPHFMLPFFQWLPKPARVWLVMHFRLGHRQRATSIDEAMRTVESVNLLNHKMMRALFADADIVTERFFGLPKSFVAVKR